MKKPPALIIVGPTASGKSALGVSLARHFNGEIISADSRQVYTGLTIGTGKITKKEMCGVPHHLLDVASPKRVFSVAQYESRAKKEMRQIHARGMLPIIVGGTGYYIDALMGRISVPEVPPNQKLRDTLENKSTEHLFTLLKKKDPRRASTIEPHNKRRLIRALEIVDAVGAVPSLVQAPAPSNELWIGIAPSLPELEKKIGVRLRKRMRTGMLAEAKRLHANGLSFRRMEELGLEYRSMARHLTGRITKVEMIGELERDIRRYAKKQVAYWKRNPHIHWYSPKQGRAIEREVAAWLRAQTR